VTTDLAAETNPAAATAAPPSGTGSSPVPVTIARGDGIGPEIMDAVLPLLERAGAALEFEPIELGESVYKRGASAGIEPDAWESLRRTGVLLKAPITTPRGKGYKSLNVTIRKTLGLYANVRPCPTFHPFVPTAHPGMNVVVIRENEEDTYGGIEHRQTPEVTQCLKLISRPGCEKVIRYAFEYAQQRGRRKITCLVKDNIMKITDGLFHEVFDEISSEHPDIEAETMIVDIGAARLAKRPTDFDVVVLPNLYGDIVSDITAEIAGSVGLAGSANVGDHCAMFEAIHGSAPDIAGRDIANPSGLLHAAILMLDHVGQAAVARRLHNAWLRAIEDGVATADICSPDRRAEALGTRDFAEAVAERLGQEPQQLPPSVHYEWSGGAHPRAGARTRRPAKELVGVDVFLDWDEAGRDPNVLGRRLEGLAGSDFMLRMITNRGVKVFPEGLPETFCTDHWRCRFVAADGSSPVSHRQAIELLTRLEGDDLDFIKTEHLYTFDGERGYSLGQGE